MDYVRKTVFELLEINTHQRVVDFIRELIKHSEKRLIIQDSVLWDLVQTYYKNQRVTYAANTSDEKKKGNVLDRLPGVFTEIFCWKIGTVWCEIML